MPTLTALLDPTVTSLAWNGVLLSLLILASHAVTSRSDESLVQVSERSVRGRTDTTCSTRNSGRIR
jgi:hypothetical protein